VPCQVQLVKGSSVKEVKEAAFELLSQRDIVQVFSPLKAFISKCYTVLHEALFRAGHFNERTMYKIGELF
jgi:hypothetical protein